MNRLIIFTARLGMSRTYCKMHVWFLQNFLPNDFSIPVSKPKLPVMEEVSFTLEKGSNYQVIRIKI